MRTIALALAVLALAGCVTDAERARQQESADDSRCASYGYTYGTDGYGQCRQSIDAERARNQRAAAAFMLGMQPVNRPTQIPVYQMPVRPYQAPAQPQPSYTTCMSMGQQISCSTY